MHKHMALDIDECINLTHIKNTVTAIIPTFAAPINCLMWAVFSMLLRSKPNGLLEHFIVCINGPDKRTGDPGLQDRKEAFLTELRRLKWYHPSAPNNKRDMPITVIRAWSRVGHPEAVEMAMPWIHTEAYLIMHDDIIITNPVWQDEAVNKLFSDPDVILAYGSDDLLFASCDHVISHGLYMLRLPNLNSTFLLCRKSLMRKIGASWLAYNLGSYSNPIQFDLADEVDLKTFFDFYEKQGLLDNPPQTDETYNFANMRFGAWVYYKINQSKYKITAMSPNNIEHLAAMSHDYGRKERVENKRDVIETLEKEINNHPEFGPLYNKYKEII